MEVAQDFVFLSVQPQIQAVCVSLTVECAGGKTRLSRCCICHSVRSNIVSNDVYSNSLYMSTKGYFFLKLPLSLVTVRRSLTLYKRGVQQDKLREPKFLSKFRQEPCLYLLHHTYGSNTFHFLRVRGQRILLSKQGTTAYWRIHCKKLNILLPFFDDFSLPSIQLIKIIFNYHIF